MKYENETPKEHLERVLILAENSESYDAVVLAAEVRRLRRELGETEYIEDPYEYAIKRTSLTGNSDFILGDLWGDRTERETALAGLKEGNAANFVKYWLVKRRKAGRIEDV